MGLRSHWKTNGLTVWWLEKLACIVFEVNWSWHWRRRPLILTRWWSLRYFVRHPKLRGLATVRVLSWLRLTLGWVVGPPRIEAWIQRVIVVSYHIIQSVIVDTVRILSFIFPIIDWVLTIQLQCSTWTKKRLVLIVAVRNDPTHHDVTSVVEDGCWTVWYRIFCGMLLWGRILLGTRKQVLTLQSIVDLIQHFRSISSPIELISVILLSRIVLTAQSSRPSSF